MLVLAETNTPQSTQAKASERQRRHLDSLRSACQEQAKQEPSAHLFAIVDVGLCQPALPWLNDRHDKAVVSLFQGLPEGSLDALSPRLVDLGPLPALQPGALDETLGRLALWHDQLPCVSWIVSSHALDSLQGHLQRLLNGTLYDADDQAMGEVMLRFYDARVLGGYLGALDQTQYALATSMVNQWSLWDRDCQWQTWLPPAETPTHLHLRAKTAERFTLKQHEQIAQHTATDRIDARLRHHYGSQPDANVVAVRVNEVLLSLRAHERYLALDAVLRRARRAGLRSDADLLLFATFHCSLGPRFDEHPRIRECCSAAVEGSSFVDATTAIASEDWESIAELACR
jgi:hypothetical protein